MFRKNVVMFLLYYLTALPSFASNAETAVPYLVEPNLTLGEISIKLYGKYAMWKTIAKWNELSPPYRVLPGQKLILKEAPTITSEEGNQLLLDNWNKHFGNAISKNVNPQEKKLQEKFQSALKNEKTDESSEDLQASQLFDLGETEFNEKNFEQALIHFRKSRSLDDERSATWIFEIKALQTLQRKEEAVHTAIQFSNKFPYAKNLPFIQELIHQK